MAEHLENFVVMTDAEVASHATTLNLGEIPPKEYRETLLASIEQGSARIEKRAYGYAVVHPVGAVEVEVDGMRKKRKHTVLEVLYLSEPFRGTGAASVFIAEIKQAYSCWPIYLICHESWRRIFFERHGFTVLDEPEPGTFEMQCPRTVV